MSRQEPFIQAAKDIVGEQGVYPLVAFGKLKAKNAWKLYADVKGIEPQIANEVSKQIAAYETDYKYADDEDKKFIVVEDYIEEQYLDIYKESIEYQGIIDGAKAHACGFLLYDGDIRKDIGIMRCTSESTGKSVLTTVIDGSILDEFGFVKDDFLIVDTVTLTAKYFASINKKVPDIDALREMVENDEAVWRLYAEGITVGINQCERDKTIKKVMKYKPTSIQELSAFVAAIRPGFSSLLNDFLERKQYSTGEAKIDLLLKDSFHFLLYQESIMKVLKFLGVQMTETYSIIKSISKKKLKGKKKEDLENKLAENWLKLIGNKDNFKKVWDVINDSANYAFNSPHSLSMACDSLYSAWFKAHYTSKFYEVSLNHYLAKEDKDKINLYLQEAIKYFGYSIGPYSFYKDNSKFVVDDNNKIIYPALTSIKGLGKNIIDELKRLRESNYTNFIDIYLNRGKINKTQFESLVKIGYFSEFGSIKYLLKCISIWDKFNMKQINRDRIEELGVTESFLANYGTITPKMINKIDSNRLREDLINGLNKTMLEDTAFDVIRYQFEILGSSNYTDVRCLEYIAYVYNLELNKYGTAFADLYYVNSGCTTKVKVDKRAYEKNPIQANHFYSTEIISKYKRRKIEGEWVELDETEDVLINYYALE